MTPKEFADLIRPITARIQGFPLDDSLQTILGAEFPADGPAFKAVAQACRTGVKEGWLCNREAGGIRYGRVIKPDADLHGFSVDVVDMADLAGPHHRHPNGEIDLIMPITPTAKFEGQGAGWLVYGPGSAHRPTVSEGRALVLYLLPQGAIEFTQA